jgi:hypothetical protein
MKSLSILLLSLTTFATFSTADRALMTLYSVASEAEESGLGPRDAWLRTCDGENIALVTREFAEKVRLDGKGRLEDGSLIHQACECITPNSTDSNATVPSN